MKGTWRERLAPLIAETLAECRDQPMPEIRRRLRAAWDEALLGPRKHWVYDVWLSECRKQLGIKPKPKAAPANEGQLTMLDEEEF